MSKPLGPMGVAITGLAVTRALALSYYNAPVILQLDGGAWEYGDERARHVFGAHQYLMKPWQAVGELILQVVYSIVLD